MDKVEINTLLGKVRSILHYHKEARDSDTHLMIKLWERHYPQHVSFSPIGDNTIKLINLYLLPNHSDIARCRRKVQNDENRYLPNIQAVADKRGISQEDWQQAMYKRGDMFNE